jgi:anti-sigma factor RsiW
MTTPSRYDQIVRALLGPPGPELTCDACFEELHRYVELELDGSDAEAAVPGMRAHLEGCPACGEDHASLLALVTAERSRLSGSHWSGWCCLSRQDWTASAPGHTP